MNSGTTTLARSGSGDDPASGLRGPTQTAKHPFYVDGLSSAAETVLLRRMAGAADQVSLAALGASVERPGLMLVDVGAGESTSLGGALTVHNPSLTYIPVDIRSDAVEAHRRFGFDARAGSATDLPLADGTVDVVHARFVLGWLDPAGRHRAVEELLRVGRPGARLVLIDYDWGSAAGPDVAVTWKDKLLEVLSGFGFDPYYGARLAIDVRQLLYAIGIDAADYSVTTVRSTVTEPIREALGSMSALVASVRDRLTELGLDDDAEQLRALHDAVGDHGRDHPDAPITFPTMVATTVDLTDLCAVAAATAGIDERRKARRRVGARRELRLAGPTELGVYRLDSAALIDQARRLHADTYLHHRYHTADSIDGEGLLVDTIDPPEVVARSTYLGVFDDEGLLAGSIRMIRPVGDDAATLPTLEKLAHRDASGSAVTKPPFRPGSVIFEVSALAKASRCHDRTITTRLLLAVVSEARRCGDDYGVMGVVANTAKLLMAVYGQQAIRPLTGDVGAITLTGTGIRPGGLTLVPCYAETATFVGDLRAYCLARPHHPLTRLNLPLIEATAAAFSSEHRAGSSRIVRARAA